MKFFLPSWNGDFRLEGTDNGGSVLIVEKPTLAEQRFLRSFIVQAVKKRWLEKGDSFPPVDRDIRIELTAGINTTSKALIKLARPKKQTLTAVKFSDGKVETAHGSDSAELHALMKDEAHGKLSPPSEAAGALSKAKPEAAVSISRPTLCCPQCVPGAVERASEVLLAFLNEEEHAQWAKHRAIIVKGGLSGHRYRLAHRGTQLAHKQRKICFDLETRSILHFYDWSVPPEEEILAAKLILEHREPWLRNEATTFDASIKYKNPFGDARDGTDSTRFMHAFGHVARGAQ